MIIAGIDAGPSGGVAIINSAGRFLRGRKMPIIVRADKTMVDCMRLTDIIDAADLAVIEDMQVASTSNWWRMIGHAEAAVMTMGISITHAMSSAWRKHHRVSPAPTASLDRCRQIFPTAPIDWSCRDNEGIADAALMALWALQQKTREVA